MFNTFCHHCGWVLWCTICVRSRRYYLFTVYVWHINFDIFIIYMISISSFIDIVATVKFWNDKIFEIFKVIITGTSILQYKTKHKIIVPRFDGGSPFGRVLSDTPFTWCMWSPFQRYDKRNVSIISIRRTEWHSW